MRQSSLQTLTLTAAEALVLQDPQKAQGRAALKLTMMELLARRALSLHQEEKRGLLGRTRTTEYLRLEPNAARFAQYAHVRAVVEVIAEAGKPGTEPTMQQVVAHARKAFGTDLSRYQSGYVIPALGQRGLVEATRRNVLGIFPSTRYQRTAEGDAALHQLQANMDAARRIPPMLDTGNPQEIAALVAGLGASLLLVDELRPHYRRLSQMLRPGATNDGGDASFMPALGGDGEEDRGPEQPDGLPDVDTSLDTFDVGDMSFASFDALDISLDALDISLDAFDSSFDASADSGGGGDGGGGDGGGGSSD